MQNTTPVRVFYAELALLESKYTQPFRLVTAVPNVFVIGSRVIESRKRCRKKDSVKKL